MKKCVGLAFCRSLIVFLLPGCLAWSQAVQQRPLIIDMHLHALKVSEFASGTGPTPLVCSSNENTVWYGWDPRKPLRIESLGLRCEGANFAAAPTDEDLMRQTLAILERYNIRAVTSGPLDQVTKWRAAAPERIIPATSFEKPGRDPHGRPLLREPAELSRLVSEGKIAVLAEVAPQYDGMSPADPALEPYFALAEQLHITHRRKIRFHLMHQQGDFPKRFTVRVFFFDPPNLLGHRTVGRFAFGQRAVRSRQKLLLVRPPPVLG